MRMRLRRTATVTWQGSPTEGGGSIGLGSGAFEGPYSLKSRVEESPATNPEELVGAGHAGCFTMSLADLLSEAGHPPADITTNSTVHLEQIDASRWAVSRIELAVRAQVPGVDHETLERLAEQAKTTCPISRALAGTEITLTVEQEAS